MINLRLYTGRKEKMRGRQQPKVEQLLQKRNPKLVKTHIGLEIPVKQESVNIFNSINSIVPLILQPTMLLFVHFNNKT